MFKNAIKYLLLAAALMLAPSAASAAASYPFIEPNIAAVEALGAACSTTVAGVWIPNVGHYAWNALSTATPSDQVIQCTGVATGRFLLDTSSTSFPVGLTVQEFGNSTTCTGVGDDTTALTTAETNSALNGLPIYVYGSCLVSTWTISDPNIQIVIVAGGSIKQLASASASSVIVMTGANDVISGPGTIDGNKSTNNTTACLSITGVGSRITGNLHVQHCNGYGIYAAGQSYFTADGWSVSDTGYMGFYDAPPASADAYGVSITNGFVDRSMDGSTLTEGGFKVHGSTTYNYIGATFDNIDSLMPTSPSSSAAIANELWYCLRCAVSNVHGSGGSMGLSLADFNASTFSNLTAFNASQYGVEIVDDTNDTFSGVAVDGNGLTTNGIIFDGPLNKTSEIQLSGANVKGVTTYGIDLPNPSTKITLASPVINMGSSSGALVAAINAVTSNLIISNQSIDLTGSTATLAYADYLTGLLHGSITGGTIAGIGSASNGIELVGGSYISVDGLSINNFGAGIVGKASSGTIDGIAISNDNFTNTTYPIFGSFTGTGAWGPNKSSINDTFDSFATAGYLSLPSNTCSPGIEGLTTAGTASISGIYCNYRVDGNLVTINGQFTWASATGTGAMAITGLPYVSASNSVNTFSCFLRNVTITASNVPSCVVEVGNNYIEVLQTPVGGGALTSVPIAASGTVNFSGSYFIQ